MFVLKFELAPGAEQPNLIVNKVDLVTRKASLWLRLEAVRIEDNNHISDFQVTPDGGTYVYGYIHASSQLFVVDGLR